MSPTSTDWTALLPPPSMGPTPSYDWLIPGGGGKTLPGGEWATGTGIGDKPVFSPYTAQNPAPWAARSPDLWKQFLAGGYAPGTGPGTPVPPAPGTDPMQPIGGPTGPPKPGSPKVGDRLPAATTTAAPATPASDFWTALHTHVTTAPEIDRDFLSRLIRYLSGGAIPEPDQKRRPLTPPRPRALAEETR